MRLTQAQREAVLCDNNALIVACPGSGKTRALIAKLLRCIEEVRSTPRKIGCITYTNAAVYEIEKRLQIYGSTGDGEYAVVSTIHSFCINNILSKYHWRIPEYKDGFSVLAPDTDEYKEQVKQIVNDYALDGRAWDKFEHLSIEPSGEPNLPLYISQEAAAEFWSRLQQQEYIDFPNIIYYTYRLVNEYTAIASGLASKFKWMLIDEFQDTSSLQVEILKKIAGHNRTRFFLVGDPEQSIFGFAGAKPQLMEEFSEHIGAERPAELLYNFRSSKIVVETAEALIPRAEVMTATGPNANETMLVRWIAAQTSSEALRDHFLSSVEGHGIRWGETAILAPQWRKLLPIAKALREYGIPIVGPGARPYKRRHLFALLAERLCDYLARPDPRTIPRIERELRNLITNSTGKENHLADSYHGRKTLHKVLRAASELKDKHDSGVDWILEAAQNISGLLVEDELLSKGSAERVVQSANDIIEDIENELGEVDTANLTVEDLGLFSNYEDNLKLVTMHKAKGREYDAVAIVDAHDGKIPFFTADDVPGVLEEGQRLLYVAITRARKLLMIITDKDDCRNKPSRFLLDDYLQLEPEETEEPW